MKNQNRQLKQDVEELVEKVTFEEAHLGVQKLFQRALSQLAPYEKGILEAHWEGVSLEDLSRQTSLSLSETQALINQLKKRLITHLQRSITARH